MQILHAALFIEEKEWNRELVIKNVLQPYIIKIVHSS